MSTAPRSYSPWLLLLAALLPYLNSLPNGFSLDDYGLIVENVAVAAADLHAFFTQDYWSGYDPSARSGLYRPLTLLSFAVEYALIGATPWLYHCTNLLLHVATTLLAWQLFGRLTGARTAWWGAAIFAVLPGHSEAVIAIAGRADLLATAASLAALLCFTGTRATLSQTLTGALCFAAALLCKEHAAVVPGLLVAIGWLRHGRQLQAWRWQPLAVSGLVLGLYLLVRYAVLGGVASPDIEPLDNPLVELHGLPRVLAALAVATRYVGLLVAPMQLSADYSLAAIDVHSLSGLSVLSGLLMAALLAAAAWRFTQRPHAVTLGLVWLTIGFAPVVNVLFPIGTILAERLTYAPSLGFALSLGCALSWRPSRWMTRAAAALLVVMAARTAVRCADWRDEATLFQAVVALHPDSARGHKGLAKALRDDGQLAQAESHYRRAIEIYPRFDTAHYNLGILLHETRRFDEALFYFERACALRPEFADAHLNRGAALFQLRRISAAQQATRRAVELRPEWDLARQNLSDIQAIIDQAGATGD